MIFRSLFRLSVFVAGFGLVASALAANAQDTSQRGRKYKSPPPTARVEVTVLRDVNAKPIENAAVIFHLVGEKGNMELDYKIDKAELAIGVKMKRPGEQYSIYPSRGNAADAGKDAAPAPAKDKPSGSSAQPDAQPSQPQPK